MIIKRIIAALIDIGFSILPVAIVDFFLKSSIEVLLYKSIAIYIIHTNIFLLMGKMTVGEKFSGIILVTTEDQRVSKVRLLVRNLIFTVLLANIVVSLETTFTAGLALILFVSLNFVILTKNKYDKPMTAIDFIFKTYYAKS